MKTNRVVLLSIKPVYAMRIFNGHKQYEFRKRQFPEYVCKVVVYASRPVCRVIGEFNVDRVERGTPQEIWRKCSFLSGIERKDFFKYYENTTNAIALKIESPILYTKPLDISIFCDRPPQSYCYIQDAQLRYLRERA